MKKIAFTFLTAISALLTLIACSPSTPDEPHEVELAFASASVSSGDVEGSIRLTYSTRNGGTIHAIVVERDASVPTAEQIVAGNNYNGNIVLAKTSGVAITGEVFENLGAGTLLTVYAVINLGDNYSAIRNNNVTATVGLEDKGLGTLESPFQISTIEDLEQIGKGIYEITGTIWDMESHYILMNDIDLAEKYGENNEWTPLGQDTAGERFNGHFDGNGFTIANLYINHPGKNRAYNGFFLVTDTQAVITNVIFLNPIVIGYGAPGDASNQGTGVVTGYFKGQSIDNVSVVNALIEDTGTRIGGLAGRAYEAINISQCYVEANIKGSDRIGGLVGVVDYAASTVDIMTIYNNTFVGTIVATHDTNTRIGGLFGYVRGAHIYDNLVIAMLSGKQTIGGIAGLAQNRAENSDIMQFQAKNNIVLVDLYNSGATITQTNYIVGNASTANGPIVIENNYHLDTSTIDNTSAIPNSIPMSLSDLANQDWYTTNVSDWDFVNTWELKVEAVRPVLKGSKDNGLIPVFAEPLIVVASLTAGTLIEGDLIINVATNLTTATVYYVLLNEALVDITVDQIKDPSSLLSYVEHGSGSSINKTVNYTPNARYFLYAFAQDDVDTTQILSSNANAFYLPLILNGNLRIGDSTGSVALSLSTSALATIYYAISTSDVLLNKNEIMDASVAGDIVYVGNSTTAIVDLELILDTTGDITYYVNAVAIATDRESALLQRSAISKPEGAVLYGTGVEGDPFILRSINDLLAMGRGNYSGSGEELDFSASANYILANDIDLTTIENYNFLATFSGTFDGAGYTIKNLKIDNPTASNVGFVGTLAPFGKIINVTFTDAVIASNLTSGANRTGTVVGRMQADSKIENINVVNTFVSGFEGVGGVVGGMYERATANNIYMSGKVLGSIRIGGFAGRTNNTTTDQIWITNLVVEAALQATGASQGVGGIYGTGEVTSVTNAIINVNILSTNHAGGVIGSPGVSARQLGVFTNIIVNANIVTTGSNARFIFGNGVTNFASASSIFVLEGSLANNNDAIDTVTGQDGETAGAAISLLEFENSQWLFDNLAGFLDASSSFELLPGNSRPTLKNSADTGSILIPSI